MKLLSAQVINFGSYSELSFDFDNKGLALIRGATGSGKSTLQDIPTWILYGVTSKNGSVDDIRKWDSPNETTLGSLELEVNGKRITVYRTRGKSSSENDLYWVEGCSNDPIRGKDLNDTQKILESKLGVLKDLYFISATFNEFSDTGNFFTNKAKERRDLFERIANLEFPRKLHENAAAHKKNLNKDLKLVTSEIDRLSGRTFQLKDHIEQTKQAMNKWEINHNDLLKKHLSSSNTFDKDQAVLVESLKTKSSVFEDKRNAQIQQFADKVLSLSTKLVDTADIKLKLNLVEDLIQEKSNHKCLECGSAPYDKIKAHIHTKEKLTEKLSNNDKYLQQIQSLETQIQNLKSQVNEFDRLIDIELIKSNFHLKAYEDESQRINPHSSSLIQYESGLANLVKETKIKEKVREELSIKLEQLSRLQDLSGDLRSLLLHRTVQTVQQTMNDYLNQYFESEFKVQLELSGVDNLDVTIIKNSIECTYRQLSKGQRAILRLCFAVAVMKIAAISAGVHMSTLFFDEALDGMDSDFKTKAFNLFQEISVDHTSVFVIDHTPEFHNLFDNRYLVELINESSTIKEE